MKNVIQVTTTCETILKNAVYPFLNDFSHHFRRRIQFWTCKTWEQLFIAIFYDVFFAIYRLFAQIEAKLRSICWTVKKQLYFLLLKLFLTRGNMTSGWITFYFQSRILLFLCPAVHVIFSLLAPFLLRCFLFLFTGIPKAIKGDNG